MPRPTSLKVHFAPRRPIDARKSPTRTRGRHHAPGQGFLGRASVSGRGDWTISTTHELEWQPQRRPDTPLNRTGRRAYSLIHLVYVSTAPRTSTLGTFTPGSVEEGSPRARRAHRTGARTRSFRGDALANHRVLHSSQRALPGVTPASRTTPRGTEVELESSAVRAAAQEPLSRVGKRSAITRRPMSLQPARSACRRVSWDCGRCPARREDINDLAFRCTAATHVRVDAARAQSAINSIACGIRATPSTSASLHLSPRLCSADARKMQNDSPHLLLVPPQSPTSILSERRPYPISRGTPKRATSNPVTYELYVFVQSISCSCCNPVPAIRPPRRQRRCCGDGPSPAAGRDESFSSLAACCDCPGLSEAAPAAIPRGLISDSCTISGNWQPSSQKCESRIVVASLSSLVACSGCRSSRAFGSSFAQAAPDGHALPSRARTSLSAAMVAPRRRQRSRERAKGKGVTVQVRRVVPESPRRTS
jgi:hypothetical protein